MASICLNMIVKNEERVLSRCFASVRPFIHSWVIVDTGSTDGTQDLIRRELGDLPGELHERAWKNFGHNRTEMLELARGKADYVLIMDADEVLEVPDGFRMPELTADMYELLHRQQSAPDSTWYLGTLVKASLPWRYEGVMHEHIALDGPYRSEKLPGPTVWGYFDSARNVDPLAKYANDAKILEAALLEEPQNARYVFYLGQSYRDAQQPEPALRAYQRRVEMGGWPEEVYVAALNVAVLGEKLGWEWPRVLDAYLKAHQVRPLRAEALCNCAIHYRATGEWALAELFARAAVAIPRPGDVLFVDDSVYAWRSLDELAIATYYVGKHLESLALNERLLSEGHLPASERSRVTDNLGYAKRALATTPTTPFVPVPASPPPQPSAGKRSGKQSGKGKRRRR